MNNYNFVSARLRQAMEKEELKQVDLLKRCEKLRDVYGVGITKGALSQYLSGKNVPKNERLMMLADALHVSEVWLMGYDVRPDGLNLSSHERDILEAYRNNKEMQPAVNRLLEVESEKKIQKEG